MENKIFGYKLKFIRERAGIPQKELVEYLKINKSTYSNYENERQIIPLKHLIKYCNKLNVSIDYLFSFTKKQEYLNINSKLIDNIAGLRLKELRESLKLSQNEFAKLTNNKRTNISGYENSTQHIPTKYLYEICKEYKISADYLVGRIDKPKNIR